MHVTGKPCALSSLNTLSYACGLTGSLLLHMQFEAEAHERQMKALQLEKDVSTERVGRTFSFSSSCFKFKGGARAFQSSKLSG